MIFFGRIIFGTLAALSFAWSDNGAIGKNQANAFVAKGTLLRLFEANDKVHGKTLDWGAAQDYDGFGHPYSPTQ